MPAVVIVLAYLLTDGRRYRQQTGRDTRSTPTGHWSFRVATSGLLAYGIVGPVAAGWMMAQPDWFWEAPDQTAVIAVSIAIGLVLPGLLIVAVVLATPDILPPPEPWGARVEPVSVPLGRPATRAAQAIVIFLVSVRFAPGGPGARRRAPQREDTIVDTASEFQRWSDGRIGDFACLVPLAPMNAAVAVVQLSCVL